MNTTESFLKFELQYNLQAIKCTNLNSSAGRTFDNCICLHKITIPNIPFPPTNLEISIMPLYGNPIQLPPTMFWLISINYVACSWLSYSLIRLSYNNYINYNIVCIFVAYSIFTQHNFFSVICVAWVSLCISCYEHSYYSVSVNKTIS